jgi:hypothetical protein
MSSQVAQSANAGSNPVNAAASNLKLTSRSSL